VFLDRAATLDKVAELTKAAAGSAGLVVFPEAFVPAYPDWAWRTPAWRDGALYDALAREAVTVPSPATDRLGEIARAAQAWLAVGVNERVGGTLYNTLLYLAPTWDTSDCWQSTMRHVAKEGRVRDRGELVPARQRRPGLGPGPRGAVGRGGGHHVAWRHRDRRPVRGRGFLAESSKTRKTVAVVVSVAHGVSRARMWARPSGPILLGSGPSSTGR
jgi:hypothetical protein